MTAATQTLGHVDLSDPQTFLDRELPPMWQRFRTEEALSAEEADQSAEEALVTRRTHVSEVVATGPAKPIHSNFPHGYSSLPVSLRPYR